MKQLFIYPIATLLLLACGGESSPVDNTPGTVPENGDTNMVLYQQYIASPGDTIIKASSNTKVRITHREGNTRSTVELVEGNAILRKN